MDSWIIRPFNAVFCSAFAVSILLLAAASLALRKKSEQTRRRALILFSFVTLIGFFVYKGFLSVDREYNVITANMGGFNWWGELPLQLCNVNMILIPIAVHWNKRFLMSFCFFVGVLGAMMALAMPGNGFDGYSLLLPRMLGYYGTHFAIVIEGLALVTFGLYRPKFRDLPMTALALFLIALAVFCINMLLRATGLHPKANYFFSVETEGNPILEFFHGWIPVPFLYMVPCIGILLGYMGLVMGLYTAGAFILRKTKARH